MTLNSPTTRRINRYLESVRSQLTGLSPDEVDSIVDDLREHIDASLQAHGKTPTLETVEAVLADMDAPESFLPDLEDGAGGPTQLSRTAVYGAILLPFGIVAAVLLLFPVSASEVSTGAAQVTWWQWLLRLTVLPLGIVSPFATTILGLVSISQIRASHGRLVGKPIALVCALFYPLILLDGLLLALVFAVIRMLPAGNLALTEGLSILGFLLILVIDILIVAFAWARIR